MPWTAGDGDRCSLFSGQEESLATGHLYIPDIARKGNRRDVALNPIERTNRLLTRLILGSSSGSPTRFAPGCKLMVPLPFVPSGLPRNRMVTAECIAAMIPVSSAQGFIGNRPSM